MINVTGLRSITIETEVFDESIDFYSDVWGLRKLHQGTSEQAYFRGTGPDSYVLSIKRGDRPRLSKVTFALPSRDAIDKAANDISKEALKIQAEPHELKTPGGGYGFSFLDPEDRQIELSADVSPIEPITDQPYAPIRLGHVVFNSSDVEAAMRFFTSVLGFEVTDYYENNLLVFLSCNEAHHCVALTCADNTSIHHIAYDLADVDALMRNVGRTKALQNGPTWGPGRHGPGGNVFSYYSDPSNFAIEYSTGLIYHADRVWDPKEWQRRPDIADVWGTSGGPTSESLASMSGVQQN